MSEIQVCEGVFRQKCGRYVAVIPCERREGGQLWTDGVLYYADDGTVTFHEGGCAVDLVEYIGPFPQQDQTVEIERLKAEWQSEFTAAQQLRAENESLTVRLQRAEVAAAEALQRWETTEQVCLKIITALAGVRA